MHFFTSRLCHTLLPLACTSPVVAQYIRLSDYARRGLPKMENSAEKSANPMEVKEVRQVKKDVKKADTPDDAPKRMHYLHPPESEV
jgi:hypothetical protein